MSQQNLKRSDLTKRSDLEDGKGSESKQEDKGSENSSNSKVTRMIILGPSANISQTELVRKIHMMELPLTVKSTCYGAIISGEKADVKKAVEQIRKIDFCNIFIKDRGFPPGDPRRCRAKRGAAREGYHQLEKEFELLDSVSEALEHPKKVSLEKPEKLPVDVFRQICKEHGREDKK